MTTDPWAKYWSITSTTVWHYTNTAGLIGILNSSTLHATSSSSLNDLSEMNYGLGLITEYVKHKPERERYWLLGLVEEARKTVEEGRFFVVCGSTNPDSLNLWRNYSGGQGYAIGILPSHVWGPVFDHPLAPKRPTDGHAAIRSWLPVVYGINEQPEMIRTTITGLLVEFEKFGPEPELVDGELPVQYLAAIILLAARLKHEAFATEQEVRMLFEPDAQKHPIQFRPGGAGITAFVEVAPMYDLDDSHLDDRTDIFRAKLSPLPLFRVRCSPSSESDRERREKAVERLLREKGYADVTVDSSTIPLAGWA